MEVRVMGKPREWKRFELRFKTVNASFDNLTHYESARILREIASKLDDYDHDGIVLDSNGNTIGKWELVD
jgi:hypothetical protein